MPASVAVGDFNGDGKQDLAAANYFGDSVSVLLGNGGGGFGAKTDFATGASPRSVAVGDFNGDGKHDLAAANCDGNTRQRAAGQRQRHASPPRPTTRPAPCPYSVAVGDFNGDGKQDLATANGDDSSVSVLLGNGGGGFAAKTDFATGSHPYSVAVGDFNGDGKHDLATANYYGNSVSVLLGNGGGGFGAKTDFCDRRHAPIRSPSATSTATASRTWRRPTTAATRQRPAGQRQRHVRGQADYATGASRTRSPSATSTATASRTWRPPTATAIASASCSTSRLGEAGVRLRALTMRALTE